MNMVQEFRKVWKNSLSGRFALSLKDLNDILARCPTIQERIDTTEFSDATWQVMATKKKPNVYVSVSR